MYQLRSVGILSVAKMAAVCYGAMGLLLLPVFLLMGILTTAAGQKEAQFGGIAFVVLAVLAPVLYAAMGFVFGALGALIYNLVAKWLGGFEFELAPMNVMPAAKSETA